MNPPTDASAAERKSSPVGRDPLVEFEAVVGAIRTSAFRYALAAFDSAHLRVRHAILRTFAVLAAALLLFVLTFVGSVLILIGAAQAVADGLERPLWSGLLIVGATTIVMVLLVLRVVLDVANRRRLERAKARIASRTARQTEGLA